MIENPRPGMLARILPEGPVAEAFRVVLVGPVRRDPTRWAVAHLDEIGLMAPVPLTWLEEIDSAPPMPAGGADTEIGGVIARLRALTADDRAAYLLERREDLAAGVMAAVLEDMPPDLHAIERDSDVNNAARMLVDVIGRAVLVELEVERGRLW